MYQQVTIVGNVGRDPEMRYTANGAGVCSFSVAVNEGRRDNQKTTWFTISAWNKLAETCAEHVKKGMLVLIVGRIEVDEYTGRDGKQRYTLKLTAREVKFLTRSDDGGQEYDVANDDDVPF